MPPKNKQKIDPKKAKKEAIRNQFNQDLIRQLQRQRDENGLNLQGINTLASAYCLATNILVKVGGTELLELDQHLLVKQGENFDLNGTAALYGNIAKFYQDHLEPDWQKFISDHPGHSDAWYTSHLKGEAGPAFAVQAITTLMWNLPGELSDAEQAEIRDKYHMDPDFEKENCLVALVQKQRDILRSKMDYNTQKEREMLQRLIENNGKAVYEYKINKKENGQWNTEEEWKHVKDDDPDYKKYQAEQKKLAKTEGVELNNREERVALHQFLKGIDISYITDEALKKSIADKVGNGFYRYNQNDRRITEQEYDDNKKLFHDLDQLQRGIRSAKPWFHWARKTKRYDAVKQSMDELRKVLRDGDTEKNRDALRRAYQKVENACNVYQQKHPQKNKALMDQLQAFRNLNQERMENNARKLEAQKWAIGESRAALISEKKHTLHPENYVSYRNNLALLTMISYDYYNKHFMLRDKSANEPFPLADAIAHPEKYQEERQKGLKYWDSEVKKCRPEVLACGQLNSQVEHFRNAIAQIDLEKEALRYLGIEETDKTKIRELLSTPENKERLKPFLDAVSGMIDVYEGGALKAVRYDMEPEAGDPNLAESDAEFRKFKKAFQDLAHAEKIKTSYNKINEPKNVIHNSMDHSNANDLQIGKENEEANKVKTGPQKKK